MGAYGDTWAAAAGGAGTGAATGAGVTGGRTGIAPAVARLTGAAGRADDASTDALIRPTATVRPKLMTMAVSAAQRADVDGGR